MRVAIIGERGIPARYSGFSTLIEYLAVRLVRDWKWQVTVYCRKQYYEEHGRDFCGVERVFLPAPGGKSFESIIHSNLSILHTICRRYDIAFVLDPGNGPFMLPLVMRRLPIVLHTDGLGWQRRKWTPLQQRYYRWSEKVSARLADWLVTDARAMQRYYRDEYNAESSFIPYSGEVSGGSTIAGLTQYGLQPNNYYLAVARLEPENNIDVIIREYRLSGCARPLVVVGNSPYSTEYSRQILAEADDRVLCVGSVYDSPILTGLFENCYAYLHGHEVGGTNPSLLRAMQAGASCLAMDVVFHREVLGEAGRFFDKSPSTLANMLKTVDADPRGTRALGEAAQARATALYRWDAVVAAYADMFTAIVETRRAKKHLRDLADIDFYRPSAFYTPMPKARTGSTMSAIR